jgi:hypothetical protein
MKLKIGANGFLASLTIFTVIGLLALPTNQLSRDNMIKS